MDLYPQGTILQEILLQPYYNEWKVQEKNVMWFVLCFLKEEFLSNFTKIQMASSSIIAQTSITQ